jgi:hypothetical protein
MIAATLSRGERGRDELPERSIALCPADHQSRELFGAKLDERLLIQRWPARHFSFPSVARRFARQRVAQRSPSLIHCSAVPRLL